ncbi:methyltransferase domain-containing protein [Basilea psittacipulmonis]|uniref:Methyltransferase type 11 domain-containing protein n=1 Tax=Basilea psittacipulmonis DSM 24701 TaxID=1072685 RepID=A0A077DFL6_9BURK|nr:methyltransferase domain-containing protein [Basilea psittacipulmonis]AIL32152.1 hypothetical protein IX83_01380 [Basilea psittacipulmonis DSM 24701]
MIESHFEQSQKHYHQYAHHQQATAWYLAQTLAKKCSLNIHTALEIGCGTGFLSTAMNQFFHQPFIQKYYLNDLYEYPIHIPFSHEQYFLKGDIQTIHLPETIDIILSSSCLQWISSLNDLIAKLNQHLSSQGYFVCALYCEHHFKELKEAANIGLNYLSVSALKELFNPYFNTIWAERQTLSYQFNSLHEVLRHIRKTGVNTHRKQTQHHQLKQLIAHYPKHDSTFPLTYDTFFYIGQKK